MRIRLVGLVVVAPPLPLVFTQLRVRVLVLVLVLVLVHMMVLLWMLLRLLLRVLVLYALLPLRQRGCSSVPAATLAVAATVALSAAAAASQRQHQGLRQHQRQQWEMMRRRCNLHPFHQHIDHRYLCLGHFLKLTVFGKSRFEVGGKSAR